MVIIIDGYNLLKQLDPGAYIEDRAKDHLARSLGAYIKRRGHTILLIFDGGIYPWPIQESKAGIMILYAGHKRTADDYIKLYIAEHQKDDLLLVSSDRELCLWASKYDCASMNSLPFYSIIKDTLEHKDKPSRKLETVVKTTTTEDPFLDALMEDAKTDIYIKEDDWLELTSKIKHNRESKIDRLLRKKIEKL